MEKFKVWQVQHDYVIGIQIIWQSQKKWVLGNKYFSHGMFKICAQKEMPCELKLQAIRRYLYETETDVRLFK